VPIGDPSQPPSRWPGYAASFVIAVAYVVGVTIVGGGKIFAQILAIPLFWGIAEGIYRYRKRRYHSGAATPAPIVERLPQAGFFRAAAGPAVGANDAGAWERGRFVVSRAQIGEIIRGSDRYDNVVAVGEYSPDLSRSGSSAPRWFFVLGKGAAVFINPDGSQVWSVRPEDVNSVDALTWSVRSLDGKTESVVFDTCRDSVIIPAWKSSGWDEFCDRIKKSRRISPWFLLIWSVETGHNPAGWLSFGLPYQNLQDGLAKLSVLTDELTGIIRLSLARAPLKWIASADPETAQRIRKIAGGLAARRAKWPLIAGMVLVALAVLLGISLSLRDVWDAWQDGLVVGAVLGVPGAIAALVGLYYRQAAKAYERVGGTASGSEVATIANRQSQI